MIMKEKLPKWISVIFLKVSFLLNNVSTSMWEDSDEQDGRVLIWHFTLWLTCSQKWEFTNIVNSKLKVDIFQ